MEIPEIFQNLKKGMGIAGVFFGVIGIVICIAAYLIVSPVIDRVEANFILTMEHASSTVGSAHSSLVSGVGTLSSMEETYENISSAAGIVEEGCDELASSLRAVSTELGRSGAVSESSLRKLNSSADEFSAASLKFRNAKLLFSSLSSSAKKLASEFNSTTNTFGSVRNDVEEAKENVKRVFGSLRVALLLITILTILVLLALICYSVGILL
ncbi:MAG: hypothetical protein QXF56_00095 [Candidatus Micrarchaeia archaeon]